MPVKIPELSFPHSEVKNIMQYIMLLPNHVRAYLAEILLESLDFEEDLPIRKEWLDEITLRCREIDEGKIALIPSGEGLARLRKQNGTCQLNCNITH